MQIKQRLEKMDPLAYPLLKWVIESVGIPIVKLPASQELLFMSTRHQFLFLTAPSNTEAEFISARRKYGSAFVFHGSPIGNWHSIIRQGLLLKSDTPQQRNGAKYVAGIYTSPLYNNACLYSHINLNRIANTRPIKYQSKELFKSNIMSTMKCLALCEVIKSDSLKKQGDVWCISHPAHICIRLLFVYEDNNNTPININTENIHTEIAIRYIMNAYIPWD
uniref:protein mono-ADP-ribosyltransferase PARP8-like n=1 Tax=Myxine glutinosa TaxID=7769 RepID=UPI00358E20C4